MPIAIAIAPARRPVRASTPRGSLRCVNDTANGLSNGLLGNEGLLGGN
jgi:hypothetical protein